MATAIIELRPFVCLYLLKLEKVKRRDRVIIQSLFGIMMRLACFFQPRAERKNSFALVTKSTSNNYTRVRFENPCDVSKRRGMYMGTLINVLWMLYRERFSRLYNVSPIASVGY